MTKKIKLTASSGNVFEDLGFKDAKQRLAKSQLAICINSIIKKREYTQSEAGEILGVSQPKISELRKGELKGFSMERLMGFLIKLDQDIKITITEKPSNRKDRGHLQVIARAN